MNYLMVGIGGILGSSTRYFLGKKICLYFKGVFPLATFIINITGAVGLGIATSMHLSSNLALLLCDGFLGAYTTFSTFMYEGFCLYKENEKINALIYIVLSLFTGLLGFMLGSYLFTCFFKSFN